MNAADESAAVGRLSRDRIVTAALEFIDEHGPEQLTMRKIGAALGVEGMALYRHVAGREGLLEAVVRQIMADVAGHDDPDLAATWQGYLQDLAHRVRAVAAEHPRAFPLVATRHPAAPWICPPLRDLELVEEFLSRLLGFGFTQAQAVHTYQSFSSFLLGQLLLDAMHHGATTGPTSVPVNEGKSEVPTEDEQQSLEEFPTVAALADLLGRDAASEQFELGLEALIDRLELSLSQ